MSEKLLVLVVFGSSDCHILITKVTAALYNIYFFIFFIWGFTLLSTL